MKFVRCCLFIITRKEATSVQSNAQRTSNFIASPSVARFQKSRVGTKGRREKGKITINQENMSIAALLQAAEYIERRERGTYTPCVKSVCACIYVYLNTDDVRRGDVKPSRTAFFRTKGLSHNVSKDRSSNLSYSFIAQTEFANILFILQIIHH